VPHFVKKFFAGVLIMHFATEMFGLLREHASTPGQQSPIKH